ncbi:MAG: hypothetical protein K2J54_05670 [Clostridia bacterium]|nr:hypothetical protein [Clostridia bacterium]
MNKGFAYYFKQAFKISAQTIWKNKNVIKSMLYFFMSLLARLTVVLGAMVDLSDVRQAKIAQLNRTVDVPQSFNKASQKPLWTMIVATAIEILMYLGGFLLVSVICGAIFAIGLVIAQFVAFKYIMLVYIIFAVPCLIIYLIYTIIVVAVFSPTAYVIDSNPALSAGDVVSVCVSSMKSRGKLTVILSVFVPMLIMLLIMGVCAAGFALICVFLGGQKYTLLLLCIWAIASALFLGFTVPVFNMTQNLSLVMLFEDIALDPVNAQKRTAGINIKKISGARVDREEVADNLNALFDDALEEKKPDSEELARKHKPRIKPQKPENSGVAATDTAVERNTDLTDGFADDDYPEEAPQTDADGFDGQTDGGDL